MTEPDATAHPDRHRVWEGFQSDIWDPNARSTTSMEPNLDAVKLHGKNAASVTPAVVRIINRYNRQVSKIRRMQDVAPATRDQLLALARRDANADLAPVRADFDRAKEAVAELTQRAMRPKPVDAAGEQRISRAWSRVERILDRAPEAERLGLIEQHLKRAKDQGDDATLAAMWESVPAYLEADERDDRGREEAAKVRDILVQIAAPPEAARAYEERKAFDRGIYRVGISVEQAGFALSGDSGADTAGTTYPGWGPNELLEVTDETPTERVESSDAELRALLR